MTMKTGCLRLTDKIRAQLVDLGCRGASLRFQAIWVDGGSEARAGRAGGVNCAMTMLRAIQSMLGPPLGGSGPWNNSSQGSFAHCCAAFQH